MRRLAIVVLNYLNDKDTLECVDSILKMQYSICGVVIVDNGSKNGAYERLRQAYHKEKRVQVIEGKKNIGYAKGNNIGIRYARNKLKADFVIVVNNDTVFIDKEYIKGLLDKYEHGVGVIGSRILLKDGKEQFPMSIYLGLRDSLMRYVNMLSEKYGCNFDFPARQGKPETVLHGCTLLFTPDFFNWYHGFYKRTFLYGEEGILYLMCKCKNLRQIYVPEVKIFHKEDQSSMMSFQNDRKTISKYALQSEKYVVLWALRYKIICLLNCVVDVFK